MAEMDLISMNSTSFLDGRIVRQLLSIPQIEYNKIQNVILQNAFGRATLISCQTIFQLSPSTGVAAAMECENNLLHFMLQFL